MTFLVKKEVRTFHLVCLTNHLNFDGLSWDKELERLGFIKSSSWKAPTIFAFFPKEDRDLPRNPLDWPKRYLYTDKKNFPNQLFLKLPINEIVERFYGKYEFKKLSKIYPQYDFPRKERVYQKLLSEKPDTLQEVINFPFKFISNLPPSESLIESIQALPVMLSDIADKISSDSVGPNEIGVMNHFNREDISWPGFTMFELLDDYKRVLRISSCRLCGNKIRGHKDKKYCSKTENPDCYREQQRVKKARQRLSSKKSP